MEKFELKTMKQKIKSGSSADDIATMVKAILRLPFKVSQITISETGYVEWKAYVPKLEPPDGQIIEPAPEDITDLVAKLKLIEISSSKIGLNFKALATVAKMLLECSKKKPDDGIVSGMTGVGWVIGDIPTFCSWMGIKPDAPPTKFFGMPLIEDSELPSSRIMLLCARSSVSDHLEAEQGIVAAMVPYWSSNGKAKKE